MLDAAGAGLQTECKRKYPTGIQKGDVAVTGPGNLKCKFIFHGCLQKYGSSDAEKVLVWFFALQFGTFSSTEKRSCNIVSVLTVFGFVSY